MLLSSYYCYHSLLLNIYFINNAHIYPLEALAGGPEPSTLLFGSSQSNTANRDFFTATVLPVALTLSWADRLIIGTAVGVITQDDLVHLGRGGFAKTADGS